MHNILLLDDDQDMCLVMEMIFEDLGVNTNIIRSFAELENLDVFSKKIDLAFLDVNLGTSKTGIDAFNLLREKGFQKPIVFFTGHARNYPVLQEKLKLPNVSLLEKPATMDDIENYLKKIQ